MARMFQAVVMAIKKFKSIKRDKAQTALGTAMKREQIPNNLFN